MNIKSELEKSLCFLNKSLEMNEEYKGEHWKQGIHILKYIYLETDDEISDHAHTIWESSLCANREIIILTVKLLLKTM